MDIPYEIYCNIWVYLPFNKIKQFKTADPLFNKLCHDNFMWYKKSLIEFDITDATYDLLCNGLSPRSGYLKIAALHGIPVTGSSKYYHLNKLIDALATQDEFDINLVQEYATRDVTNINNIGPILYQIPREKQSKIIDNIAKNDPNTTDLLLYIAARSGNFLRFKDLLDYRKFYAVHFIKPLILSENLGMIKWSLERSSRSYAILETNLYIAVTTGNIELVSWILSKITKATEVERSLEAAIKSGNEKMVDILINSRVINTKLTLQKAVPKGYSKVIEYVLSHPEIFTINTYDLFKSLGILGDIKLIDSKLDRNHNGYNTQLHLIITYAAKYGHLQVLKHLGVPPKSIQYLFDNVTMTENSRRYLLQLGASVTTKILLLLAGNSRIQFFIDFYNMAENPDNAAILSKAILYGNGAVVEFMYNKHPFLTERNIGNIKQHHHLRYYFQI